VVDGADSLVRDPIRASELFDTAVLVRARAYVGADLLGAIEATMPWMRVWRDHELWRTGVWTCRVTADGQDYTAQRTGLLRFHTDMSRYPEPPAFTLIRVVVPDGDGGGGSMLVHVDDACARLEAVGEHDVLTTLRRKRRLHVPGGGTASGAIVAEHGGHSLARVFDPDAATKGLHLEMSPGELAQLRRFVDRCHEWIDLVVSPPLEAGDLLVFSNHTFLHARAACADAGRVSEIVLGNASSQLAQGRS
jgi:hypothetical protein